MADTLVSLGGFVFTSWAVPEQVNGGGRQSLVVHKLIGGTRVIDVMGGTLTGFASPDCCGVRRRRAVPGCWRPWGGAAMRWYSATGPTGIRCWSTISPGNFQRFYEIAYDVGLTVLADLTQDGWQSSGDTLDERFGADLSSAGQTAAAILPSASPALGSVAAAQASAGTLQGASQAALQPLAATVSAALAVAQGLLSTLDAGFPAASAGGVVAGGDPGGAWPRTLSAQAGGLQQLAAAAELTALLTRAQTNLATAPAMSGSRTITVAGGNLFRIAASSLAMRPSGIASPWRTGWSIRSCRALSRLTIPPVDPGAGNGGILGEP